MGRSFPSTEPEKGPARQRELQSQRHGGLLAKKKCHPIGGSTELLPGSIAAGWGEAGGGELLREGTPGASCWAGIPGALSFREIAQPRLRACGQARERLQTREPQAIAAMQVQSLELD